MSALEDIAAERARQIEVEGWDESHDASHTKGELVFAAVCYAFSGISFGGIEQTVKRLWPWNRSWWKPKNPRRDLIRAAALIVAEIDRRDRREGGL